MDVMDTKTQQPIWTKSFVSISITQFLLFVVFYAFMTTLPIYVIQELGGNASQAGILVTAMLLTSIIIRPFSGRLLEIVGKKRLLIITVFIYAITTFLYVFFKSFEALLILRLLHGLTFGIVTTATGAIAADSIPEARRGTGLGYFAMALNVGIVIGPFIGLTMVHKTSFHNLFLTLSIISIVSVICAIFVQIPEQKKPILAQKKISIHTFFELKAIPIGLICSLVAFSYASIISFISLYATTLNLDAVASYFFLVFAAVMILSRPSLGRVFDNRGPSYIILPCLIIFMIGLVVLSFTNTATEFLLSAGLIGLGYGSLFPSFQAMAIQSAENHRSGHATATFFTMYDIGIALGTYILGVVVTFSNFQTVYRICAGVLVIVFIAFIVYQSIMSKAKLKQPNS